MGQKVGVVSRRVLRSGLIRYDLNHSLTGVSHEAYEADFPVSGDRPSDILARRLFETGTVTAIHVHSNVVTVTFGKSTSSDGEDDVRTQEILNDLYTHYLPGVRPTPV